MDLGNFFSELKRRNVYKVAVAYIVGGWALSQGIAQVFPVFEVSNWAIRLIVLLIIVGFPVAVVSAWFFEITPDGVKRTETADAAQQKSRSKAWIYVVVIGAMVSIGLFFLGRYTAVTGAAVQSNEISAKSIAVLPFENLSSDKENAYFAEGIQDEILTRLSKIANLKVISRNSTQKYKSAPDNLADVGKQLGVANLLEGSVQKVANAVHVNVQLIRATTDEHVWAESYDRKLDDVFGVEADVATAIAEQLNAKLTGAEERALTEKPTQDTAAYDAYLRGLTREHNEYSFDAYIAVSRDYAEAVRLDPRFGPAWARLAIIRSFLYFNRIEPEINTAEAVKDCTDRATAIAPEAAESWIAQGAYRYRVLRDFGGALAAYKEAQKRQPNSAHVYQYLGYVQRRLGRWEDAEVSYKRALELDPRDVQLLSSMAVEFYGYLRRYDDALAVVDQAIELSPDDDSTRSNRVSVLQNMGRLEEAAQELARISADSNEDFVVGARVTQAMYQRHYDLAIAAVKQKLAAMRPGELLDGFARSLVVTLGLAYEGRGRPNEAREAFARVVREMKPTPDTPVPPDANDGPSILAVAYAGLGDKDKAFAQARRSTQDYADDAVNLPYAEVALAEIQARFGDHAAAIAALPHLLEIPAGLHLADLKFNPIWDPIRNDPRFQKLSGSKQ